MHLDRPISYFLTLGCGNDKNMSHRSKSQRFSSTCQFAHKVKMVGSDPSS
jgi:hypothetical protein